MKRSEATFCQWYLGRVVGSKGSLFRVAFRVHSGHLFTRSVSCLDRSGHHTEDGTEQYLGVYHVVSGFLDLLEGSLALQSGCHIAGDCPLLSVHPSLRPVQFDHRIHRLLFWPAIVAVLKKERACWVIGPCSAVDTKPLLVCWQVCDVCLHQQLC